MKETFIIPLVFLPLVFLTLTDEILKVLNEKREKLLNEPGLKEKLKDLNVCVELIVSDLNEHIYIVVENGDVKFISGTAVSENICSSPIVIRAKKDVILKILNKEMNLYSAYFMGRFKVNGDMSILINNLSLIFD